MSKINIHALSAEERKQLLKDLSQQELSEKEKQENDRKAYKDAVNETVSVLVERLRNTSNLLAKVKLEVFRDLKAILDLKQEVYKVKNTQQSHTFTDHAGNSIVYGFRVLDSWDDSVSAGIEKVNNFLLSLIKDEDTASLVQTIQSLMKKDAKGNLKLSNVYKLAQLAERHQSLEFKEGVEIIRLAYKSVLSAFYIEAYYTDKTGKKINVPLSTTSVDFPEGTDIDSLFPVHEKYNI